LAHDPGFFVWHELVTTDVAAAAAFYRGVVGWGTQEASTSKLPYQLFTSGAVPMAGILELPDEGRRMGAMPRWIGYVGVRDVHVVVGRIKRLGGTVYVPPTDTDIGMISVVADRQSATFALVGGLRTTSQRTPESGKVGHVGWHELLAADLDQELAFYGEVNQKATGQTPPIICCHWKVGRLEGHCKSVTMIRSRSGSSISMSRISMRRPSA
jgi:predicted enzyme related to lactoylglutathione lyase